MRKHLIYYTLKPYLPRPVRMAVRRVSAGIKRKRCRDVWPIQADAGRSPPGWDGWPEGKKFSLVLTHDVEGPEGLARSQELAELELEMGFRSSFNFIPEGSYSVPASLRHWMARHGFEVGVHDLEHDGKLFRSEAAFRKKACRINDYLRDWGAVGFRSGFMLRNLDWLHDLNIQYDASTFDTDPFELQSDGVGTIFPFWKAPSADDSRTQSKGYLELPYTLPQDSTLFLVLREPSPEIWLRKLDWIAAHGGMALVNVHPDYIAFNPGTNLDHQYPLQFYRATLQYIKERYAGQYWNPLPSELARWHTAKFPPPPRIKPAVNLARKRAAVLLYSTYPADPRPRRAAEAMVEAGMEVDLLSLSESDDGPRKEKVNGVNVFRLPFQRSRGSKWIYFWLYTRFLISSFWFLTWRGLRRRYDVVHVHNMPDFLVFAAIVPKLRGAKVILDLHDPMPELMVTIYDLPPHHVLVGLLRRLERWSLGFANLALTPNLSFKKLFVSRSCPSEKIQIIMNSPQQEIFNPDRFANAGDAAGADEVFRVMHHGSIVHRHGVDVLVEAIARVRAILPVRLDIYGSATPFLEVVLKTAQEQGVADVVHYHGSLSQAKIAEAIRHCHVGVVPNRRSVFTEINFPTRLFEYLSMHRPVIAPDCRGIRDCFGMDDMIYFTPGDAASLAEKLIWVHANPQETKAIVARGLEVYRNHLWSGEKARFQTSVSSLLTAH